jgi:chaperone required for assembly of F1-ATPase
MPKSDEPELPRSVPGREAPPLRKRFYTTATVAAAPGGSTVHLDGRPLRTPRKLPLVVPAEALATAIAAEWDTQAATINPATMPVTRLVFTALDAVAEQRTAVAAEIGRYAASDLLCYRAPDPAALAQQQADRWDPLLAWAATELGVPFKSTTGLMPVAQSPDVQRAMEAALAGVDAFSLSAVHVLTTLTGSALLALAVLRHRLALDEAWQLAHLDEDWQSAKWGTDAEAAARREQRHAEARAAAAVIGLLQADASA